MHPIKMDWKHRWQNMGWTLGYAAVLLLQRQICGPVTESHCLIPTHIGIASAAESHLMQSDIKARFLGDNSYGT